jgi:hypothetical protein
MALSAYWQLGVVGYSNIGKEIDHEESVDGGGALLYDGLMRDDPG